PPPPPVFFLPPPPPDFVDLPPCAPPVGLFVLPQPVFVVIPAYVRPPAYVAPPPNNVIFNNIHNTTVIKTVINVQQPAVAGGSVQVLAKAAASGQPVGAGVQVPLSVSKQAQALLNNQVQLTPSQRAFVADPTARAGNAAVIKANVTTTAPQGTATPGQNTPPMGNQPHTLPMGNQLPPTSKGGPAGAAPPGVATPNTAKLAPGIAAPPPGPATGSVTPNAKLAPSQAPAGPAQQARPGVPPPPSATLEERRFEDRRPGTPPAATAAKPVPA